MGLLYNTEWTVIIQKNPDKYSGSDFLPRDYKRGIFLAL